MSDESKFVDVVFDGPPSHESGRFVEVEDSNGKSIGIGEWVERDDGFWALRISPADYKKAIHKVSDDPSRPVDTDEIRGNLVQLGWCLPVHVIQRLDSEIIGAVPALLDEVVRLRAENKRLSAIEVEQNKLWTSLEMMVPCSYHPLDDYAAFETSRQMNEILYLRSLAAAPNLKEPNDSE